MAPLQGVGVLVTRPEQQAPPLCRLLEEHGAVTFRFPAIVIAPVRGIRAPAADSGAPDTFDIIIFTSANAVRFGASLLDGARAVLAAIGPATARALEAAGHRATLTPQGSVDTEGLLRHPDLANPTGRRILIVKGRDGRDTLHEQLARRGAEVHALDVYLREPAHPGASELDALLARLQTGELHVVTATSADIVRNLLGLANPAIRAGLERLHWLVPGARVAAAVREHGVQAAVLEAASAEDHALVEAVLRWRGGGSVA